MKRVTKISSKASIFISGIVGYLSLDIEAFFMTTNIIILALYFFQISPKFQEQVKHLITILQTSCKKKVIPLIISVADNEDELYVEANYSNENFVNTNNALFQISKWELAKIL